MMTPHAGHPGTYRECAHPDCVTYRARYRKRWQLDRERGIKRTIDPTPIALHVATLLGQGWSCRGIAGAAGVAPQTVTRLKRGDAKTIGREAAAKILAVNGLPREASHQTTEPFVPRVGTVRRLQALQVMGWTTTYLRDEYGINPCTLYQQGRWVTRSTHDKVARAYRELSHRRGPSERTTQRALARGYVGPADWNDIDLDEAPEVEWVLNRKGNEWQRADEAGRWIADDARRVGGAA